MSIYKKETKILSDNNLYIFCLLFGFSVGAFIYTFFIPNYFNSSTDSVKFEIIEGSSLSDVIQHLYDKELINSRTNMKIASLLSGSGGMVKSGEYNIPNGLTYFELLNFLSRGTPGKQITIRIPEGIWQYKLAQQLRIQAKMDSAKIMKLSSDRSFLRKLNINTPTIEGYLLPDTYYFYENVTPEEVLIRLNNEMEKLFDDQAKLQMKKLGLTKNEILTLASLVDGESNKVSEFRRIAGVYYNRIKKRIKLQADPTIQYLIRNKRKYNKIYYKYLEIDSPYNTYKHYGLPPTPINNPGRDAVLAALYPEKHSLLFFVADGTGGHVFSKTSREHKRNVAKYRRWRRNNR